MKNKFYVGAPHLLNDNSYCKATLNGAIQEAREKCDETDQDQIVVKIVAIVKQTKNPIKVVMVK